ncbi:MAG: 3-hydroxyacyl-CoA dehydrogenase [Alphaproteobacteria bacterium]|nr:3-hydroxyacyl-CoA dehydrogenase [Alphaproteobacteria bacterium]
MTRIAIVGAGIIGGSWALVFARAGHEVRVFDETPATRAAFMPRLEAMAAASLALAPGQGVAGIAAKVRVVDELAAALDGAAYVQESVPERREVKRPVLAAIDRLAPPEALIASSTSSFPLSTLVEALPGRARCLVVHPATPPHLLPVVELAPAPFTPEATVARARELMVAVGQTPVLVKRELPTFVMNRLQGVLLLEMFRLIREGYVSAEDADALIRDGFGLRWAFLGPLEGVDLNAPGGIADYLTRYGWIFDSMANEAGVEGKSVTPELVAELGGAMRAKLPLEKLGERTAWRDRSIAALRALRRDAGR